MKFLGFFLICLGFLLGGLSIRADKKGQGAVSFAMTTMLVGGSMLSISIGTNLLFS